MKIRKGEPAHILTYRTLSKIFEQKEETARRLDFFLVYWVHIISTTSTFLHVRGVCASYKSKRRIPPWDFAQWSSTVHPYPTCSIIIILPKLSKHKWQNRRKNKGNGNNTKLVDKNKALPRYKSQLSWIPVFFLIYSYNSS